MTAIKSIFVIGPTATGKTAMAVDIARHLQSEIISIDSRQLYQGMDLGTGKDLSDFTTGGATVPHHLIDILDPATDEYHLHRFISDAKEAIESIASKNKTPILCGGTILYTNALLQGYELAGCEPNWEFRNQLEQLSTEALVNRLKPNTELFDRADRTNRKRIIRAIEMAEHDHLSPAVKIPNLDTLILAPYYPRKTVHQRIETRLDQRLNEGMIEEVEALHQAGVSWDKMDWFGLEYRWVSKFLKGEVSRQEMRDKLLIKIRQFAKSQDIWLRKLERQGQTIHWITESNHAEAIELVDLFLADQPLPEPKLKLSEIYYGPKSS